MVVGIAEPQIRQHSIVPTLFHLITAYFWETVGKKIEAMIVYPDCPYCENSNTVLSVEDVSIGDIKLRGVICNNCKKLIALFKDDKEMRERCEGMEDRINSIESELADLSI